MDAFQKCNCWMHNLTKQEHGKPDKIPFTDEKNTWCCQNSVGIKFETYDILAVVFTSNIENLRSFGGFSHNFN